MLLTDTSHMIVVSWCLWRRKEADCFTSMNADCCFARLCCHPSPPPPHHVCTLHVCLDWRILCDFSPFVCKSFLRRRSVVPTTSMRVIIAMLLCTSLWRAWLDENLTNGVGCGVQMYNNTGWLLRIYAVLCDSYSPTIGTLHCTTTVSS
jgi:hypothetical protein